jgi:hypothetical protein
VPGRRHSLGQQCVAAHLSLGSALSCREAEVMAAKRARRRRRAGGARWQALDAAMAAYRADSVRDLLAAAACAPAAAHRLASIGVALQRCLTKRPAGRADLPVELLARLADAAHADEPRLARFEADRPLDPRRAVRVRLGDARYLLHPGLQTFPVADVHGYLMVAQVVDETLTEQLGFGIHDLVEMALRHTNATLTALCPLWTARIADSPDAAPSVTAAEVAAMAQAPDLENVARECEHPDRAAAALAWATLSTPRSLVRVSQSNYAIAPAVAVQLGGGRWPLPPPLLLAGLQTAVMDLAAQAVAHNPDTQARFDQMASWQTARMLSRLRCDLVAGTLVAENPGGGDPVRLDALVRVADRHELAVRVVASLDGTDLEARFRAAAANLLALRPAATVNFDRFEVALAGDAQIVPLLIQAGPAQLLLRRHGRLATLSLADLMIILMSAEHPDDLWCFCADLVRQDGISQLIAQDGVDIWETWRSSHHSLPEIPAEHGAVFIAPQGGAAEWQRAADREPLEQLLAMLRLPELLAWERVVSDRPGEFLLVGQEPYEAWLARTSAGGLAIQFATDTTPHSDRGHCFALADTIRFMTAQLDSFRTAVQQATAMPSVSIALQHVPLSASTPLRLTNASDHRLVLGYDERLWSIEDPDAMHRLLGEGLADGLTRLGGSAVADSTARFLAEWLAMPPGIRVYQRPLIQAAQALGDPQEVNDAFLSAALRAFTARLDPDRLGPKSPNPADVSAWLTTVAYPIFTDLLTSALAPFSAKDVLDQAALELERVLSWRLQRYEQLDLRGGIAGVHDGEQAEDWLDWSVMTSNTGSVLSRSIGVLIEVLLAHPPTGSTRPDRLDRAALLALAQISLHTALISEGTRYRIEFVSPNYGTPTADLAAWRRTRAALGWGSPGNPVPQPSNPEPDSSRPREERALDSALRQVHGCGIEALLIVLTELRAWPVSEAAPVGRAQKDDLIAFCAEHPSANPSELGPAIDLLTLRGTDLADHELEHWAQESRPVRLATRPIIQGPDGRLWILPWRIATSLNVYLQYLQDGRLPWPDSSTDPTIINAQHRYSELLDRRFEDDVSAAVAALGMPAHVRLTPNKARRLGVRTLRGEIDLLVCDRHRARLWVLEAKHHGEVFSPPQMARRLRDFHKSGAAVDKLLNKTADVTQNLPAFVASFDGDSSQAWEAQPLMVTRHVELAAFVPTPRVPFAVVSQLAAVLRDESPGYGVSH